MATQSENKTLPEKLWGEWSIINGPQKYEFLDALAYRMDPPHTFGLEIRRIDSGTYIAEVQCLIIGKIVGEMEQLTLEGDEWSFVGAALLAKKDARPTVRERVGVKGRYKTRSPRQGKIELMDLDLMWAIPLGSLL